MKKDIPVLGDSYNYFHDGKITSSRRKEVIIREIIPFGEIDKETLNDWQEEVKVIDWLYSKETDFFIKVDLKFFDCETEKMIFVRTIDNNWFSLGLFGGILDIDGSLNDILNNNKI
jgi:hypothetical protein